MRWLLVLLPGGLVLLVVWELVQWQRRRQPQYVSTQWLREFWRG